MPQAQGLDMSRLIARYNEAKAKQATAAGFVRLQTGENRMRLVTFTNEKSGAEELYVEYQSHFLQDISVACLKSFGEKSCPVCDYVAQLRKRDMSAVAKKIAAKTRYYFNVISDGEVKVLEVGRQIWDQIMAFFADAEYGNIADLRTGCDIKIKKDGSGINTEYAVMASRTATAVKLPGEPKDLTKLVVRKDVEELESLLYSKFERLDDEVPFSTNEATEEYEEKLARDGAGKASDSEDEFASPSPIHGKQEKAAPSREDQAKWADKQFGPKSGKPSPAKSGKPSPAKPGKR